MADANASDTREGRLGAGTTGKFCFRRGFRRAPWWFRPYEPKPCSRPGRPL